MLAWSVENARVITSHFESIYINNYLKAIFLYFQYYFLILHDFSLLLQLRRLFVLLAVHVIVMEGSKSITMENGELSVMTAGISLMHVLSAKVWVFLMPQLIDVWLILEQDLERYG